MALRAGKQRFSQKSFEIGKVFAENHLKQAEFLLQSIETRRVSVQILGMNKSMFFFNFFKEDRIGKTLSV
jgi:hypothetical protein